MRPHAAAIEKRRVLEKTRGWVDTLDWLAEREPPEREVRDALEQARGHPPATPKGKLYRMGQVEALEWFLGT